MPGKVILVAFHFPPIRHSSGLQRTLKFCTYLRDFGWHPSVLTVSPVAYENVGDDQMGEIPDDVEVVRAFGLDSRRHLAIKGRYFDFTARPDRYGTWWYGGILAGLHLLRKTRANAIWSTTPVPTAHKIGGTLSRLSGRPWVADFRDPMTDDAYPPEPAKRRRLERLERSVLERCSKAVVTTQSTQELHRRRYPNVPDDRWVVIPNGYDEENFAAAEREPRGSRDADTITLVHAGILYPSERDPRVFFRALAELKTSGALAPYKLRIVLRATLYDKMYAPILRQHGIDDIVRLEPAVSYRDALREMLDASGVVIFQGSSCNHQIPAKIYEYFRAGRPILGLADPSGDTAKTLVDAGCTHIAPLDDATRIKSVMLEYLAAVRSGAKGVSRQSAIKYSRRSGAESLARVLDAVTSTT